MSRGPARISSELTTFVDLLRWRAQENAGQTAYRFLPEGTVGDEDLMTYEDLDRRARAIAALLMELQGSGQRVVLLYPPSLDYIAAFFGCLYAGAIAVPAYPPRPNRSLQRIQSIIQDSGATVALTQEAILTKLEQRFSESPELKALYWLSTDGLAEHLAEAWQRPALEPTGLALLQYTSGSTAAPKGVMISHDNLLHNSSLINEFFQDSAASSGVSWLPPYHDMGLVGGILQPLYLGVPMTLMPPVAFLQKPMRWLQAISHYRATTSGGPNFAYDLCVRKTTPDQWATLDLSAWRLAFSGAEPILAETLQRFAETFAPYGFQWESFYPCYGMAETTLIVTGGAAGKPPQIYPVQAKALQVNQIQQPVGNEDVRSLVNCGAAPEPDQVCIVDPASRQVCPADTIGEIWVRHFRSMALGYWNRPEETQHSFAACLAESEAGPFLRTGDLGFLHDGQLYVTGRLKDLIIIRGRNHYPQDIEMTVEQAHPALRSGAGAAFSVSLGDAEQLVLVQELERSYLRKVEPEVICAAIRQRVAEHHDLQVSAIVLLKTNSLPKTSSGKIQRYLCRSGFLDRQLEAVYTWEAATLSSLLFDEADARGAGPLPRTSERVEPSLEATPEGGGEAAREAKGGGGSEAPQVVASVRALDRPLDAIAPPVPTVPGALELPQPFTAAALQTWMVRWLAQALPLPETAIDVRRPFAEYGLDSVTAVELADALETALELPLEPTLAYEYPTIEALAGYLAGQKAPAPVASGPEPAPETGDHEVDQLVRELDMLSDAEIQELLGQQNN